MRWTVKFIERKYEDDVFKKGILNLGTFDFYRSMEENDGIGDSLEASSLVASDGLVIDEKMPEKTKSWVEKQLKSKTLGSGQIRFESNVTFRLPNTYLFCASHGSPSSLSQPADRDAAFVILNRIEFYEALYSSTIMSGSHKNKKLSEISEKAGCGRVTYREIMADVFGGSDLGLSPFVKRPSYSYQSEFRFLFSNKEQNPIVESSMLVKLDNIKELIRRVDLPLHKDRTARL